VKKIDVRIIAATSVDLQQRVDEGRFRADLFYRLNVLSIRVPPLRERVADMEALCENILEQIELRTGLPHRELMPDAIDRLRQCAWRGNIRELQNALEKVAMFSDKTRLAAADLDGIVPAESLRTPDHSVSPVGTTRPYAEAIEEFERQLLTDALAAAHGRVQDAARSLGLARATLYRKMHALGVSSQ
jgi:DNA-binding NtrC family response regulator